MIDLLLSQCIYNSRQICDAQYVEACWKEINKVRSEFSISHIKTYVGF